MQSRAAVVAVASVLVPALLACAQEPADDPLEALRLALSISPFVVDPQLNNSRAAALTKAVVRIKSPGQVRQALTLPGWQDNEAFGPPAVRQADTAARGLLVDRLRDELARTVKDGEETAKLAAAQVLRNLSSVRGVGTKASLGRDLTGLAVALTADKSPAVRASGARALGRMDPVPGDATAALKGLLKDQDVEVRRAAAEALWLLVQESQQTWKAGYAFHGEVLSRRDVVETSAAAVTVLVAGAGDPDPEVRRLCLKTYHAAAVALEQLAPVVKYDPPPPPFGTPMTEAEKGRWPKEWSFLDSVYKKCSSLVETLLVQSKVLNTGLEDRDISVVCAAAAAVEELAAARRHWRLLLTSLPIPDKDGIARPATVPDDFGDALRATVPLLAKQLGHQSVEVKLAVLYALETLERDAAPAAAALAKTLDDPDAFVRWGAARALGRMAGFEGKDVETAVKALGKRLADDNVRVRTSAAVALKHYGPAAKAAVADLATVVVKGDDETRKLAMRALAHLGADAKPAVAALAEALTTKETSVRLEAARTLGEIGPAAKDALPALRKALDDSDATVALAAAEAVLAIGATK